MLEISEVRIKLIEDSQERLLAFCSITINGGFVVRDIKIINGTRGPFVAMPSRKLCDRCGRCGCKNHLRAAFCSQCGVKLRENRSLKDPEGRAKLYADVAHPINSECRDTIQNCILSAYQAERILAQQPDYQCRYDDLGEDGGDYDEHSRWDDAPSASIPLIPGQRLDEPQATPAVSGPHAYPASVTPPAAMPSALRNSAASSAPRVGPRREKSARSPHSGDEDFGDGLF